MNEYELMALSDQDLAIHFHDAMERHDRLIDSAPMGDERIYFANKECERAKAEQTRRGYRPCEKCFDFGDITDMHGDEYGFCDCHMGIRLKQKVERRSALSGHSSPAE